MDAMLLDAATRLFTGEVTPEVIATLERGGDAAPLWSRLVDAGLTDALRPEALGGVGLSWASYFPLARAAGEFAVPLPLVETTMLRALFEAAPDGPIAIAPHVTREGAGWHAPRVPHGASACWLALDMDGKALLVPLEGAQRSVQGLDADITLPLHPRGAVALPPGIALMEIGALAQSARITGALSRVLAMSLEHVTTREQFGRRIGAFQAVQHQLAQLAEAAHLASMACEMGFIGGPPSRGALLPALAKARCSALVPQGAAIAHAVHGAMGIACEFPLQIFTRALHAGRLAFGTESVWQERVGRELLGGRQTSGDFVDMHLTPHLF
jgi:acyl-CoA dehydrogenase